MRIWSKQLIPVLSTKHLKSMRYELGDMIKQYPNIKNPLVKFANNYDCSYLLDYFERVVNECVKREVNMDHHYNMYIIKLAILKSKSMEWMDYTFKEDNEEYLKICWWNLYEKQLRGVITQEEWKKIEDLVGDEILQN